MLCRPPLDLDFAFSNVMFWFIIFLQQCSIFYACGRNASRLKELLFPHLPSVTFLHVVMSLDLPHGHISGEILKILCSGCMWVARFCRSSVLWRSGAFAPQKAMPCCWESCVPHVRDIHTQCFLFITFVKLQGSSQHQLTRHSLTCVTSSCADHRDTFYSVCQLLALISFTIIIFVTTIVIRQYF